MLCPSVLIIVRFYCFLSYLIRSSLTNRTRQKKKAWQREIPIITLLLAPSLHASCILRSSDLSSAIANVQKDPPLNIPEDGIKRQSYLGAAADRPLEAKSILDVITNSCNLVALCCIEVGSTRLPTGHLPPSASCRALWQCSWKLILGRVIWRRMECESGRSSFCCDRVGTRMSSSSGC